MKDIIEQNTEELTDKLQIDCDNLKPGTAIYVPAMRKIIKDAISCGQQLKTTEIQNKIRDIVTSFDYSPEQNEMLEKVSNYIESLSENTK